MATITLILEEGGDTAAKINARYGIVTGGGANQAGNFASLKSKLIARVEGGAGPATAAGCMISVDGGGTGLVYESGKTVAGIGSHYAIVQIEVPDGTASLAAQYRISTSSQLKVAATTFCGRILPLLESLGVGRPANITISDQGGGGDSIRAQAGDAF